MYEINRSADTKINNMDDSFRWPILDHFTKSAIIVPAVILPPAGKCVMWQTYKYPSRPLSLQFSHLLFAEFKDRPDHSFKRTNRGSRINKYIWRIVFWWE